jgi:hypothetical protein
MKIYGFDFTSAPSLKKPITRLSHIMFYVDGKSNLANPLVNLAVVSYTEQWSALAPAGVLM